MRLQGNQLSCTDGTFQNALRRQFVGEQPNTLYISPSRTNHLARLTLQHSSVSLDDCCTQGANTQMGEHLKAQKRQAVKLPPGTISEDLQGGKSPGTK